MRVIDLVKSGDAYLGKPYARWIKCCPGRPYTACRYWL